MSAWDDEDWENGDEAVAAPPQQFFSVGGSWDDEDVEDDGDPLEAAAAPKPSAPMKPSKVRANLIRQKDEADRKKAREAALKREKELQQMNPGERKEQMEKLVRESDFESAKDLFMGGTRKALPPKEHGDSIDTFKPSTDDEFRKLASMIGAKVRNLNVEKRKMGRYVQFVKDLMKEVTVDLGPDDAGEISKQMTFLANQKRDAYKKAKGMGKKKGNKKISVKVDRPDEDYSAYDDPLDDFM